MNIDQQLASLLTALDDVLDLERGLADATLPHAHTALMAGIDDALDLETGLAQVMAPVAETLEGLAAFVDELSSLPAAERLATRTWLPARMLAAARDLAGRLVVSRGVETRAAVVQSLDRRLHDQLVRAGDQVEGTSPPADRLAQALFDAAHTHAERGTHDLQSVEIALVDVLDRILDATTGMVGADLALADLAGLPLDGVRWSSGTRWPVDWAEWVRDNSMPISADVFEIRSGKAGSSVIT